MWVMKETDEELTIKAFPIVRWSIALSCFITGAIIAQEIFVSLGGFSMIAKFLEGKNIYTLFGILFFSLFPIGGLIFFYFSPFIITKIDRQKRIITIIKIGITGKKTEVFSYNALDGGFRVKSEEDEDKNEYLQIYFNLKSGRKINTSSELTRFWQGRVYDVAMKANEYLQAWTKSKT